MTGSYAGGWSSRTNDLNQWFQIDLGIEIDITFVATQGRNQHNQWVTKYKLLYGKDGKDGNLFVVYRQQEESLDKV